MGQNVQPPHIHSEGGRVYEYRDICLSIHTLLVLKKIAVLSEKNMDLVDFAKELGYGDISKADNYQVHMMYVGEDGDR